MFRKLVLVAAAAVALGATALAPTTASARWHGGGGGGWHHGGGGGFHRGYGFGPRFAYYGAYGGGYGCYRTRYVRTPWGVRLRRVNVCY